VLAGSLLYFVANGDRSWFVGAIGTVLAFGALLAGAMFLIRYRHALRRLNQMRPPEATLVLSAEGFTISTTMSSATIRWSAIKEILERPNFWLLFLSSAQFITVPTSDVSRAELEIIRSHVVASGGKVA
jgi:YcxB-like protein